MSRVGFIGLGTMGRHMARNLLAAGHELCFFARRPEIAAEFQSLGARQAATPADVTRQSEVIFAIVPADAEVLEVALGTDGILAGGAPGKTFIDMSTIGPWTIRQAGEQLAAAGMDVLDAPVSGGPWGAEAGTLSIMAGGERAVFDRCLPLLSAMGAPDKIFHVGPLGAGQVVKLINQMLGGAIMALVGEAFVLGKAAGADLPQLVDVLAVSSGNSAVLEGRGKKFLLADNFQPGFKTELMRKDVGLALELARQLDLPMPVASAAFQQYNAAIRQGLAECDFAAVAKVCEQAAGIRLLD